MAIQLAQTPDEFQRAFNVQSHSEIVAIRLVYLFLRSEAPAEYLKDGAGIQFRIGHKVGSIAMKTERILTVTVDCGLWALPSLEQEPARESNPVFGITATFEATYELQGSYEPAPEDLKAFSDGNVVFNVWPFFREYAQNTCLRFGYPGSPAVPLLRLVSKPPPEQQQTPSPRRQRPPADKERTPIATSPTRG